MDQTSASPSSSREKSGKHFVVKPPSQGMGTVPKDGRQVLLWDERDGAWVLARYQADQMFESGASTRNMCWCSGVIIYCNSDFVAWLDAPLPPSFGDRSDEPERSDRE